MNINVDGADLGKTEVNAYIQHIEDANPGREISSLNIDVDGDFVNLNYTLQAIPFDRIRRITGYLVGTVDRFNNGKRAEELDRVKHSL